VSGDIVYTAGQIANDPEGNLVAGGIAEQARRTLENVRACVEGPVFNPARVVWDRWRAAGPSADGPEAS